MIKFIDSISVRKVKNYDSSKLWTCIGKLIFTHMHFSSAKLKRSQNRAS